MAKILRQKNKKDEGTANIPEGVREMLFTVGQQETEMFQMQNDHLRDKGMYQSVKTFVLLIFHTQQL